MADPVPFLTLGRSVSLLLGLATVALVFVLGRALGGTAVGLAGALFVAVSPVDVIVSNNLGPWCLATLLTVVVFLFIHFVSQRTVPRWRLVALGAALGLAVAAVYTMTLLALPVAVALVNQWRQRSASGEATRWQADVLAVAGGGVIGHVLGNFSALLHPGVVLREFSVPEASLHSDQSAAITYLTNTGWYFGSLFDHLGLGWVLALCGALGLLLAAWRLGATWTAILTFTAVILLLQPAAVVLFANRYTAPLSPLIAMAAAWLIVQTGAWVGRMFAGRSALPTLALVLLVALPGLLTDITYRDALAKTPTRELARRWIEANLPRGDSVIQSIDFMGPAILDCKLTVQYPNADATRPCYDIRFAPIDPEHFAAMFLDYAARSDAAFLVYTATTPPGTLKRMGRSVQVSAALRERYPLLARFEYPGLDSFHDDTATVNPAVEIYGLKR